ncbi:phosphatase [uncultured archaeon]|nr:phosphatase [uncultured archaeon]
MIKGVIFDLDGTILDSVDLRVKAWRYAFQMVDISVPGDEIRPLIGLPGENLAGRYYKYPDEVEKMEEQFFKSHLSEASFYSDVGDTFTSLSSRDINTVIVTSSRKDLTKRLDIPVNRIVTIDDVTNGKPDTEPYLKALAYMKIEPSELMVVGDSESDLMPAKKLGALSVMVLHGRDVESKYADYYVDEIGDVVQLIDKVTAVKYSF